MIYVLDDDASKEFLQIKGELFKYLVKVRRHQTGDKIAFRNRKELDQLYIYEVKTIENRVMQLELLEKKFSEVKAVKSLHIGWCVIDPKSVEKVLPSLSEIGVAKISFIFCDRSQKNFKPDFKRYERILEASMQQCGRSTMMEFGVYKTLGEFLKEYPETKVFDFCENVLDEKADFETVLIGCEGGFSQDERELLSNQEVFRLNTRLVLRSESAALAVASKILL